MALVALAILAALAFVGLGFYFHKRGQPLAEWPMYLLGVTALVVGILNTEPTPRDGARGESPAATIPESAPPATTPTIEPDTNIMSPSQLAVPEIIIATPDEGETVPRPVDVSGRVLGWAPESQERIWAGRRGDSFYYLQGSPCVVQADATFECPLVRLGTLENRGPHKLCVLLLDDRRPFPDPTNRKIPPSDLSIVTERCVEVTNEP